ncbi:MAG: hypothetical protein AAGD28_19290 [Bacteroidota bacterium]
MKFIHTLFLLASCLSLSAKNNCPEIPELLNSFEYKWVISQQVLGLDAQHQQGLSAIAKDIANLHSSLQVSSIAAIKNHKRINIEGNWNQACLVNLLTLIQNQGINRKMMNDAALTSLDMMLDLVDPFLLPFTTFKRFLTSEVVEEMILDALKSDDPEESLNDAIDALGEKNNIDMENSAEGDKVKAKLKQLMDMYALSKENAKLPDDAKWHGWSFDPGMSSLDDVLSMVTEVDHTLLSQAMVRFGTTPKDENPVEDSGKGEGSIQQRLVVKGVADKPYPKSQNCKGQILDYEIVIKNYGHVEDGKFVSDHIEYDIILNCCEEEDGNISYEPGASEPISYIPGTDYAFLPAGIVGLGRSEGDNLFCIGASAQFYPDMPLGACGAQPALGLQVKYGYQGNSADGSSFSQSQLQLVPQALLLSPIIPNLRLISGLSFPISFGNQVSSFSGQDFKDNINSFGVSLTTGLSLELPNWNIQLQTDLASFIRTTTSSGSSPGSEFTESDFGFWLNKSNPLTVSVGKRIESF